MGQITDGILLIDKQEGETSFGVVKKAKRLLKIRKAGHAGTLDPFATGLLIILLGQGTKLSRFLMAGKKTYLATVKLGIETDTLDSMGREVRTHAVPDLTLRQIGETATRFVGDIEQVPPLYSAVKYEGQRAYKLARKGVVVTLRSRIVTVHSLEVLSVQLPDVQVKVTCSSGTYIRSLAADFGRALGTGGHLIALRRSSSGPFEVQSALSSAEISTKRGRAFLEGKIIPLRVALSGMCEITVGEEIAKKIRSGHQPSWNELNAGIRMSGCEDEYVKLVSMNELVAIARIQENRRIGSCNFRLERVFS
jgi:tRNA pseudouridine55 synthase